MKKYYITTVLLGVLAIGVITQPDKASYANIDIACMTNCEMRGYTYGLCEKMCTY